MISLLFLLFLLFFLIFVLSGPTSILAQDEGSDEQQQQPQQQQHQTQSPASEPDMPNYIEAGILTAVGIAFLAAVIISLLRGKKTAPKNETGRRNSPPIDALPPAVTIPGESELTHRRNTSVTSNSNLVDASEPLVTARPSDAHHHSRNHSSLSANENDDDGNSDADGGGRSRAPSSSLGTAQLQLYEPYPSGTHSSEVPSAVVARSVRSAAVSPMLPGQNISPPLPASSVPGGPVACAANRVLQHVSGNLHQIKCGNTSRNNTPSCSKKTTPVCGGTPGSNGPSPLMLPPRSLDLSSHYSMSLDDSSTMCFSKSLDSGGAAAAASQSLFDALPHNSSFVASNRGEYIRHQKLGEGACGSAWIVEWRPTDKKQQQEEQQREGRRSSMSSTRSGAGSGGSSAHGSPKPSRANSTISHHPQRNNSSTPKRSRSPSEPNHVSTPEQERVATLPPARVSGLACCRPFVDVAGGSYRIPFDRCYVLKVEKKLKSPSQQQQTSFLPFASTTTIVEPGSPYYGAVVVTPHQHNLHGDLGAADEEERQRSLQDAVVDLQRQREEPPSVADDSAPNSTGVSRESSTLRPDRSDVGLLQRQQVRDALRQHAARDLSQEGSVLRNCAHPNIVGYVDHFEDEHNNYLVMEYVDGGDMRQEVLRRAEGLLSGASAHLSVASALFLWVQALCAIEYLHRHDILHRDLKTANLLCSQKWRVLVADFGFGKDYGVDIDTADATTTAKGTPHYMAPEMYLREGVSGAADVWALGVILYELLTLRRPFEQGGDQDAIILVASRIVYEQHPPLSTFRDKVPTAVQELVDRMLDKDPKKRPTVKQVLLTPVVAAALDEFYDKFSKAATATGQDVDPMLAGMLGEHIALVREDTLSSPESRRKQHDLRREQIAAAVRKPAPSSDVDDG